MLIILQKVCLFFFFFSETTPNQNRSLMSSKPHKLRPLQLRHNLQIRYFTPFPTLPSPSDVLPSERRHASSLMNCQKQETAKCLNHQSEFVTNFTLEIHLFYVCMLAFWTFECIRWCLVMDLCTYLKYLQSQINYLSYSTDDATIKYILVSCCWLMFPLLKWEPWWKKNAQL